MQRLLPALAAAVLGACAAGGGAPDALPVDGGYRKPVSLAAFAPDPDALPADAPFEGRLVSADTGEARYRIHTDTLGLAGRGVLKPAMPGFDFAFVTHGRQLLPEARGPVIGTHPAWEYMLAPGRIWKQPGDGGWNRAAVPFTLRERNADCMHHGVLGFRYDGTGRVSALAYQVSSQTCAYLKFTLWGRRPASYVAGPVAGAAALKDARDAEVASRLDTKPLTALAVDFRGADASQFGAADEVPPQQLTARGFVVDGVHYTGSCPTRHGDYPYCDELVLPSYSLAKSLFAGLAVARAELLYPGISGERIDALVPACAGRAAWAGVTIAHAMDMATGNFDSRAVGADEDAMIASPLFVAEDSRTKTGYACRAFPRRAAPGTTWVYHTSDIYLAGVALSEALRRRRGPGADLYRDLVVDPLWKPLGLSPLTHRTRRTYDDVAQPFFAWGLAFHRGDLALLARFLGAGRGRIGGTAVVDEALLAASLQRDPRDRGQDADIDGMKYRNGFRGLDVAPYLGCSEPAWAVVLSGFGGIILVLLPNDTAYYYVSDGNTFRWMRAARESNRIRPFCVTAGATGEGE